MFNRNSILFFSLSSFCTAVTILLTLFSLQHSKVTLVSPLMASIPLFTLILSFFFLKKEETITKSITIGTIVMFLGIQLVIFFT